MNSVPTLFPVRKMRARRHFRWETFLVFTIDVVKVESVSLGYSVDRYDKSPGVHFEEDSVRCAQYRLKDPGVCKCKGIRYNMPSVEIICKSCRETVPS